MEEREIVDEAKESFFCCFVCPTINTPEDNAFRLSRSVPEVYALFKSPPFIASNLELRKC